MPKKAARYHRALERAVRLDELLEACTQRAAYEWIRAGRTL